MTIRVTLKDPDTMHDAVDDYMERQPKPEGISELEWRQIAAARADAIKSAISDKFMEYGEYLTVDFEVSGLEEDMRVIGATVVPN